MNKDKAQMIFTDAPYNVKITGHVCANGKIQHEEFYLFLKIKNKYYLYFYHIYCMYLEI